MGLREDKLLYKKAKQAYYNAEKTVMSDAEFDKLEDKIRKQEPSWSELRKTGVRVENKKTEVELEHFMPSLAKFYPDRIDKWTAKYPDYTWMDKLDGSSIQVIFDRVPVKVITRGDGTLGGDISFKIPHLNIPRKISVKGRVVFRCEAVMREDVFQKKWAKKFENARAMVNGLLNRKEPHPGLADIDIVVLGVYGYTVEDGLELAQHEGFNTVIHGSLKSGLDSLLSRRKDVSPYKIDGLVLANRTQVFEYLSADKPKWIVAYKENDEEGAVHTTVRRIVYQVSRLKRIVPKIELEPVRLNDTTVTFATCHNAKWMIDRGIGPGAIVKILKSGEVIPKIVGVAKRGETQLPEIDHVLEGVHFVATGSSTESNVRKIVFFIKTLGIEFCGKATIEELYDIGLKNPLAYLKAWHTKNKKPFIEATGSKIMAEKIWAEFDREFNNLTIKKLMVASGCFDAGIGFKRLDAIEKRYDSPNIFESLIDRFKDKGSDNLYDILSNVPGFGDSTTKLFLKGLPDFCLWLTKAQKYVILKTPEKKVKKVTKNQRLSGQAISWTGYRDKEQEAQVEDLGGEVVSFGSKTTILLYGGKGSTKVDKARDKGIKVMTFDELKKQFNL